MKIFVLGGVALAAMMAGPATAADMPLKAPPPVAAYSWSGCYVGVEGGGSWGRSRHTSVAGSVFEPPPISPGPAPGVNIAGPFNLSGALVGGEAGCNYQSGGWVIGFELDGSVTTKDGQGTEAAIGFPTWVSQTTERGIATARLRLGYAGWDKWLWYVTGGGAWAKFDLTEWDSAGPIATTYRQTDWRGGWTVGAGAEYALGHGWSVKSEFLYVDFGAWTTFTNLPFASGTLAPREVRAYDYIVRFGMNYRFDWTRPVVAKY
jgi:outer membrane immunogenic protein